MNETALEILLWEAGRVFTQVLEDAGVYKRTEEGQKAFLGFVDYVNQIYFTRSHGGESNPPCEPMSST